MYFSRFTIGVITKFSSQRGTVNDLKAGKWNGGNKAFYNSGVADKLHEKVRFVHSKSTSDNETPKPAPRIGKLDALNESGFFQKINSAKLEALRKKYRKELSLDAEEATKKVEERIQPSNVRIKDKISLTKKKIELTSAKKTDQVKLSKDLEDLSKRPKVRPGGEKPKKDEENIVITSKDVSAVPSKPENKTTKKP